AVKQNAKQESDSIVKVAGQIKDIDIGDANQLSAEAASKTNAIQDSIAKDKQNAAPPAHAQAPQVTVHVVNSAPRSVT
ncbi:hypothetical protein Q6284_34055, partial [Klebsiella pneumoniae]|nr:hypothetical protein [Klebsiella pneumoniae]